MDLNFIDEILARHPQVNGSLIAVLQEVQAHCNYLPEEALRHLSAQAGIPITRLYSIASFYHFFSLKPKGRHQIHVCLGTACHVKGGQRILEDFERRLGVKSGETTADGLYTLNDVRCIGACSFAPAVVVDEHVYAHVTSKKVTDILKKCGDGKQTPAKPPKEKEPVVIAGARDAIAALQGRSILIRVCMGLGGVAAGATDVLNTFRQVVAERGINATVTQMCTVDQVGCMGFCAKDVIVEVTIDGATVPYQFVKPEMVARIVDEHIIGECPVEAWRAGPEYERFHSPQNKIVLGACGTIDPEDIDAYLGIGGYEAARIVLAKRTPEEVVNEIQKSGLRGRGGAGFPTGVKWDLCRGAPGKKKVIICNADEGDPGAFMDRAVIEGDPHAVIEGMIIGAYAMGATEGYVYIRAEYPLAIQRLRHALDQARRRDFLGADIMGLGMSFDIQVKLGAGAFVCGEETALIASLEDQTGEPRPKPPFPAQKGLWGFPTNINNVETWATVPKIMMHGAEWFASIGSEKSKGTKIFALVGKIRNTGLVEVPMGTPLRKIIYEIGGGIPNDKKFKAVQTGGPSGGCIPAEHLDVPVDYENLGRLGSIMGSGGMVVMDENTCMVDVAKYFVSFCMDESCGKCTPCREGTREMVRLLEDITAGKGTPEHLSALEELSQALQELSLCGLGKTVPNPVVSTLRFFRQEYEAHIHDKKCPAGVCKALITFSIDPEKCTGCRLCASNCPQSVITGEKKKAHVIEPAGCIRCGVCFDLCKFGAVLKA